MASFGARVPCHHPPVKRMEMPLAFTKADSSWRLEYHDGVLYMHWSISGRFLDTDIGKIGGFKIFNWLSGKHKVSASSRDGFKYRARVSQLLVEDGRCYVETHLGGEIYRIGVMKTNCEQNMQEIRPMVLANCAHKDQGRQFVKTLFLTSCPKLATASGLVDDESTGTAQVNTTSTGSVSNSDC